MVEEGILGIPENVLAAIPDLEIFPLELFDVFLFVPVPATAQVHKLLEGYFPIMDRDQQGIETEPGLVDFAFVHGGDAGEVGQVPLRGDPAADFLGSIECIARTEE